MKNRIIILALACLLCANCASCSTHGVREKDRLPVSREEDFSPTITEEEEEREATGLPTSDEPPRIPDGQTEESEQPATAEPPEAEPEPDETEPDVKPAEILAAATDKLVKSVTNGLRVRTGPGTGYASVGTLDCGDMARRVAKQGNWYEIEYMRGKGYVYAAYVTEEEMTQGSAKVEKVISEGAKLLGIPYVFGAQRYHWGNGKLNSAYDGKSYDCSSLMQYIFKIGAGVNLAMTSREQSLQGIAVSRDNIRRGDLLFFTNASRVNKTGTERIGHVAVYLGDNIILHTASDHAVIEPIDGLRWGYYISARRVI